MLETI